MSRPGSDGSHLPAGGRRAARLIGLCGAAALALAGCAVKQPTLKLRDIEVVGLDFRKLDLLLDFAVTNPNTYQISLYGLEYDWSAGGERIAHGTLPRPVTPLGARQTAVVTAPVSLEFRRLGPLAAKARAGESIRHKLTAKATFDFIVLKRTVTMQRTGALPVLRAPSWHFRDVRLVRKGEGGPGIELVFEVDNPNRFALPLRRLTGELKYGGETLLRVDRPSMEPVGAGKKARLTVPVKLDPAGAAGAVLKAIEHRRSLRFEGRLELDPPVSLHEMLLEGLDADE